MKRLALLLAALSLIAATVASVEAAPRKPAIGAGADRAIAIQRTDAGWAGTWYWYQGSSFNATNLTGVTGLGLLEAYRDSKDGAYLDSAKKAAAFAMAHLGAGATGSKYSPRMTASDVILLHRLAKVTGDSSYSTRASSEWANIKSFWPTAAALESRFTQIKRAMGAWDLAAYLEAARLSGDTVWSDQAAAIIANTDHPRYYDAANPYLALNAAGALRALAEGGYAGSHSSSMSTLLETLVGTVTDDSIGGWVQDTAYAVMAFRAVGGPARSYANDLSRWLASRQASNGGWIEADSLEYAEVDGEAVTAMASTIGANVTIGLNPAKAAAKAGWRAAATRGIARSFDAE